MKNYNFLSSMPAGRRAVALAVLGYVCGDKFCKFEFCRSFLRPWCYSLGAVGAWLLQLAAVLCMFAALWVALWVGYELGFTM